MWLVWLIIVSLVAVLINQILLLILLGISIAIWIPKFQRLVTEKLKIKLEKKSKIVISVICIILFIVILMSMGESNNVNCKGYCIFIGNTCCLDVNQNYICDTEEKTKKESYWNSQSNEEDIISNENDKTVTEDLDKDTKLREEKSEVVKRKVTRKLNQSLHLNEKFKEEASNQKQDNVSISEPQINSNYSNLGLIVTYVVDGDTFELSTGQRVRLICIDTPERGNKYYREAKDYLEDLVLNKEVSLIKDVSETDRYNRLLRYVYVGDTFVNYKLVESGNAKVYRYAPDTSKCDELEEAEFKAKNDGLGIWNQENQATITPSSLQTSSDYDCSSNKYSCGDFRTYKEAQAVYEVCGGLQNDVHKLDRNKDGKACESLP